MADNVKIKKLEKQIVDLESRVRKLENAFTLASNLITDDVPVFNQYLEGEDPLYEKAVNLVKVFDRASASLLQRRLTIGYARAARLMDLLEAKGVVGPLEEFSKGRAVLIKSKNK